MEWVDFEFSYAKAIPSMVSRYFLLKDQNLELSAKPQVAYLPAAMLLIMMIMN